MAPNAKVQYDAGTDPAAAAALAKASEIAIVFVNHPTSEGGDAASLTMPGHQDELVAAVAAANPRTIVVLEVGSPVTMPWVDQVNAVLNAWYPGIRGAEAIANILFGRVNPSGKLPLTFPKSEADLPHPQIAGSVPRARYPEIDYNEGLKVGYKWYDAENRAPLFAFGHGLSYTTFAYSDLKATPKIVSFTVKNTGKRAGAEIAQVYVSLPPSAGEPPKRLVAWEKVQLAAGESKAVNLDLDAQYLSVFDPDKDRWELLPGDYKVLVGGSSRSTPLQASLNISR